MIGGAVAPLVFTALYLATGSWYLIAGYLAVASLVTVVGLALGRNPHTDEEERLLQEAHA